MNNREDYIIQTFVLNENGKLCYGPCFECKEINEQTEQDLFLSETAGWIIACQNNDESSCFIKIVKFGGMLPDSPINCILNRRECFLLEYLESYQDKPFNPFASDIVRMVLTAALSDFNAIKNKGASYE